MENLNAEQIRYKMSEKQIKTALECLSKPNSSPADREKCYFMWKEPSCLSCHHEVAQNALALITSQEQRIKELTEENERLREQNERYAELEEGCYVTGYKNIKADTVREMCQQIKEYFPYDADSGLYVVLDQIEKEMLEGDNEVSGGE